jgi:hypothetical protein
MSKTKKKQTNNVAEALQTVRWAQEELSQVEALKNAVEAVRKVGGDYKVLVTMLTDKLEDVGMFLGSAYDSLLVETQKGKETTDVIMA